MQKHAPSKQLKQKVTHLYIVSFYDIAHVQNTFYSQKNVFQDLQQSF